MRPFRRGTALLGSKSAYCYRTSVAANGASIFQRQLSSCTGIRYPAGQPLSRIPARADIPSPRTVRYASSASEIKKTQLYNFHVANGAKMVPFAGFSMPLQYKDLSHLESHHWTREKASLFDVSHM